MVCKITNTDCIIKEVIIMYYNKSTRKRDSVASDAVTQYVYENLYKHIYKEPYRCTEKAYESLINLCVDICKRNGIKKLIWKEGKQYCPAYTGRWDVCNMVPHRYTTDKGKRCPGNYLFGKYGEIAEEVNKRLSASTNQSSSGGATTETPTSYLVKINTDTLNVRKGPGTSYEIAKTVKKGQVYTIVQESNGWGKLKSGAGWIKLSYTKKI